MWESETTIANSAADIPKKEPEKFGTPREGASLNEVVNVMLGGAEVYTVRHAAHSVRNDWKLMTGMSTTKRFVRTLQMLGAGVSGFALGFYAGYSDSPNCSAPGFSDQLQGTEVWRHVGQNLLDSHRFRFERSPANQNITAIMTHQGYEPSLRDVWIVVNSVIRSRDLAAGPADFVLRDDVHHILESNTEAEDPMEYLPFWYQMVNFGASCLSTKRTIDRTYVSNHWSEANTAQSTPNLSPLRAPAGKSRPANPS